MMNSISTSKIVVGIGLAAVFGIGVSELAVHSNQANESQVALNAPTPAMADAANQNAVDATVPAQGVGGQGLTDRSAAALSASSTASSVVTPTPAIAGSSAKGDAGIPASDESGPAQSKKSDRADRRVAKARSTAEIPATRVVSAANSIPIHLGESASSDSVSVTSDKAPAPTPSATDPMSAATAGLTADAQQAPAQAGQAAAASVDPAAASGEPVASDSQITAKVKSEISTAAPNSNVEVSTTNGIVALAGSVPSKDAIIQAQEAAQRVAGVKYVDSSALVISNQ